MSNFLSKEYSVREARCAKLEWTDHVEAEGDESYGLGNFRSTSPAFVVAFGKFDKFEFELVVWPKLTGRP